MDLLDFILVLMALSIVCSDFFFFQYGFMTILTVFQLHLDSDVCKMFD